MDLEDLEERLNRPRSSKLWIGCLFVAIGVVGSTFIATRAWIQVRTQITRTIEVTGSAKRRITSNLIQWTASISTVNESDRVAAYRALKRHVQSTLQYLSKKGIKASELRVSAVETRELMEEEVSGSGDNRLERRVLKGYKTTQHITVSSTDVAKIEQVSREVTDLIEAGVPVASSVPEYYYTRLGELKIEMLAEAAKDARQRAEQMLSAAGNTKLSELRTIDMGVINVNPPNSTATSWEGNNDTTTIEKDIITIVHCTFDIARTP